MPISPTGTGILEWGSLFTPFMPSGVPTTLPVNQIHSADAYIFVVAPPFISNLVLEYEGFRLKLFDFGDGTVCLTVRQI